MKTKKKVLISVGVASTIIIPSVAIISCGNTNNDQGDVNKAKAILDGLSGSKTSNIDTALRDFKTGDEVSFDIIGIKKPKEINSKIKIKLYVASIDKPNESVTFRSEISLNNAKNIAIFKIKGYQSDVNSIKKAMNLVAMLDGQKTQITDKSIDDFKLNQDVTFKKIGVTKPENIDPQISIKLKIGGKNIEENGLKIIVELQLRDTKTSGSFQIHNFPTAAKIHLDKAKKIFDSLINLTTKNTNELVMVKDDISYGELGIDEPANIPKSVNVKLDSLSDSINAQGKAKINVILTDGANTENAEFIVSGFRSYQQQIQEEVRKFDGFSATTSLTNTKSSVYNGPLTIAKIIEMQLNVPIPIPDPQIHLTYTGVADDKIGELKINVDLELGSETGHATMTISGFLMSIDPNAIKAAQILSEVNKTTKTNTLSTDIEKLTGITTDNNNWQSILGITPPDLTTISNIKVTLDSFPQFNGVVVAIAHIFINGKHEYDSGWTIYGYQAPPVHEQWANMSQELIGLFEQWGLTENSTTLENKTGAANNTDLYNFFIPTNFKYIAKGFFSTHHIDGSSENNKFTVPSSVRITNESSFANITLPMGFSITEANLNDIPSGMPLRWIFKNSQFSNGFSLPQNILSTNSRLMFTDATFAPDFTMKNLTQGPIPRKFQAAFNGAILSPSVLFELPQNTTTIPDSWFSYSDLPPGKIIPDSTTYIGDQAFIGAYLQLGFEIPNGAGFSDNVFAGIIIPTNAKWTKTDAKGYPVPGGKLVPKS